jgi:hypothetical protein
VHRLVFPWNAAYGRLCSDSSSVHRNPRFKVMPIRVSTNRSNDFLSYLVLQYPAKSYTRRTHHSAQSDSSRAARDAISIKFAKSVSRFLRTTRFARTGIRVFRRFTFWCTSAASRFARTTCLKQIAMASPRSRKIWQAESRAHIHKCGRMSRTKS